jgi:glycosyltransferase involved in cell wall biosynthesis
VRVLFYLLDGDTNASSQQRVLQFLPFLRANGIDASVSRPVPAAVYDRLVERSRGGMPSKVGFYGTFLVQRALDIQRAQRADVVVIQRDLFPFGPPLLERRLLARNPNLVYDVDDATYLRPSFTPNTVFQRLRRFDKVADIVRRAHWVSAATEPIASWARTLNQRVQVVPMAVDPVPYRAARRRVANDGIPVVLGWAGTTGGVRYLEALGPVLRQLAEKHSILVRVVSGGYRSVCLPGVPLDARPWRPESQLVDIASFDIGLVPLDDTSFEQAKFPSKLLQYMALGVPTVSSQVGTVMDIVRHGANGLLASSPAQWLEHLAILIRDAPLKQRLADAAVETVESRFTIERVGPLLVEGLRSAAQPRPAARY